MHKNHLNPTYNLDYLIFNFRIYLINYFNNNLNNITKASIINLALTISITIIWTFSRNLLRALLT